MEYDDRFHGVGTLKDEDGKIKYDKIQVDQWVNPVSQPWSHTEATETGPIIRKNPENKPTMWVSIHVVKHRLGMNKPADWGSRYPDTKTGRRR